MRGVIVSQMMQHAQKSAAEAAKAEAQAQAQQAEKAKAQPPAEPAPVLISTEVVSDPAPLRPLQVKKSKSKSIPVPERKQSQSQLLATGASAGGAGAASLPGAGTHPSLGAIGSTGSQSKLVTAGTSPGSPTSSGLASGAAGAAGGLHRRTSSGAASLEERYVAHMVLCGVGDAMGYYRGSWEFTRSGAAIHQDMMRITENKGIAALEVSLPKFPVSDDTVMQIATAKGFLVAADRLTSLDALLDEIAREYVACFDDMDGRAPGGQTMSSIRAIGRDGSRWREIPFSSRAGGCGAAMRSMCIGLAFPHGDQLNRLITVAVESGRMTHHNPTGYLGSLAGALFTALALQNVPVVEWGARLLAALPKALKYVQEAKRDVDENTQAWAYFTNAWTKYLAARGILDGKGPVQFPSAYGVKERDAFYKSVSFDGWGGSSGHDAPMIAYDALLGCNGCWEELCLRGVLHGGDSDSTGCMAGAWFGTLYGFKTVPKPNYEKLEYRKELAQLGRDLYRRAFFDMPPPVWAKSQSSRASAASVSASGAGSAGAGAGEGSAVESKGEQKQDGSAGAGSASGGTDVSAAASGAASSDSAAPGSASAGAGTGGAAGSKPFAMDTSES